MQCKFAASTQLPFPLVGDSDKKISQLYGVLFLGLRPKRVTFVIDEKGIVQDVLHHEIRIARHRDGVLDILRALRGSWLAD